HARRWHRPDRVGTVLAYRLLVLKACLLRVLAQLRGAFSPSDVGLLSFSDVLLTCIVVRPDAILGRIIFRLFGIGAQEMLVQIVLDLAVQLLGLRGDLLPVRVALVANLDDALPTLNRGGDILHV